MLDSAEQQRLVQEVFAANGRTFPLDDPIVLAALFTSSMVRSAGQEAATAIEKVANEKIEAIMRAAEMHRASTQGGADAAILAITKAAEGAMHGIRSSVDDAQAAARYAGKAAETASTVAVSASRQVAVHQAAFVDIWDRTHAAAYQHAFERPTQSRRKDLCARWHYALTALAGALVFATANFAACGFSLSWADDASIGRQFLSALPFFALTCVRG